VGFIKGLLGIGNNNGANFQAQGVNPNMIGGAQNAVVNDINQQQQFVDALGGQNGIGNQSNVFNQQQMLANQLGRQAQGQGPNPALNQLSMTTGQNIANQAALMAGQRGVGNNPGLAARNIANQGAAIQQQATGQAALQRAQQQLAAQQQLQAQQGQMAGLASQQVGQQHSALQGMAGTALGNQQQLLGMQANMNNANAGIAGTNAQSQAGGFGSIMGSIGSAVLPGVFAGGGEVTNSSGPQSFLGQYAKSFEKGGKVAGKAKIKGNSYSNDKVPALLSPGEIVLPRSVTQSDEPIEKSKKFVSAVMAKGKRS